MPARPVHCDVGPDALGAAAGDPAAPHGEDRLGLRMAPVGCDMSWLICDSRPVDCVASPPPNGSVDVFKIDGGTPVGEAWRLADGPAPVMCGCSALDEERPELEGNALGEVRPGFDGKDHPLCVCGVPVCCARMPVPGCDVFDCEMPRPVRFGARWFEPNADMPSDIDCDVGRLDAARGPAPGCDGHGADDCDSCTLGPGAGAPGVAPVPCGDKVKGTLPNACVPK